VFLERGREDRRSGEARVNGKVGGGQPANCLGGLGLGLVVSELRKSFGGSDHGELRVLTGVSFEVSAGGRWWPWTGAFVRGGKVNTFLHLLGGLEARTTNDSAGRLDVTGCGCERDDPLPRKETWLVFQFHHLLPDLSAADECCDALRILRQTLGSSLSLASEHWTKSEWDRRFDRPVGTLSAARQTTCCHCAGDCSKAATCSGGRAHRQPGCVTGEEIENPAAVLPSKQTQVWLLQLITRDWHLFATGGFLLEEGILRNSMFNFNVIPS